MNRMQSIGGTKIKSKFDMRTIISDRLLDLLMQITEVDDARHISGLIVKCVGTSKFLKEMGAF